MAGGADFGTTRRRGASDRRPSTICLTGEEQVDPGVAAQASSPAGRERHGGVPSPRHRVGPWVPVMPLKVGPSFAGGDILKGAGIRDLAQQMMALAVPGGGDPGDLRRALPEAAHVGSRAEGKRFS
jgi:hypothetical protein